MPDLTLSFTTENANRLRTVIGTRMRLKDANGDPRAATLPESKAFVADLLKTLVRSTERSAAEAAIVITDVEIT